MALFQSMDPSERQPHARLLTPPDDRTRRWPSCLVTMDAPARPAGAEREPVAV